MVNRFIELVRKGDKTKLAQMIDFPLWRRYPLPSVSHEEFLARYEEIFDDDFITIITSTANSDCGRVGWRGLQLHRGLVWFTDGRVRRVNYQSRFEEQEKSRLINLEKDELHPTLREFHSPVLEWETCTYRLRIDRMTSMYPAWKTTFDSAEPVPEMFFAPDSWRYTRGYRYSGRFRYAAWRVDRFHDSEPNIIIEDGELYAYITDDDDFFFFSNGEYKYVVVISSEEHPDGVLEVYRTNFSTSYEVRYEAGPPLLAEPIVNRGTQDHYRELLNRLRNCSHY